ncbi:MAG: hypothetical protein IH628_17135 [Proteobacteria bacterium]|nr:hypothetical protein [Pseudomonadota bacterium]
MTQRWIVVGILIAALSSSGEGLPKFASRTGLSCQSCHVNPAGGGMRKAFGVTYGQEELPVASWQEEGGFQGFSTKLNDYIAFGADLRTLYFYQRGDPTGRNSFFQMQTDVYLSAQVAKKATLVVGKGQGDRFEAFGIANVLPLNGYIKAGWFSPAYGLRMDDHNIFARSKTLFASNAGQDAGVELALSPGPVTLTAAVSNGASGTSDDNQAKAMLGRAEGSFAVSLVNVRLGGMYYNNTTTGGVMTLYGGFAMVSVDENLTLLGEYNRRRDFLNMTATAASGNIFSLELDYLVTQGFDLKIGYDFYDEDILLKSGTEQRYVFGAEFFPMAGVELRPMYVIRKEEPTEIKNDQVLVLLHVYL